MNGTSSAAPYTAGVIALMMQKKPEISSGEIKSILELNVTSDSFTGKLDFLFDEAESEAAPGSLRPWPSQE